MLETVTGADQVDPPLVELKAEIPLVSIGTTTVPLGCTSGCPPIAEGVICSAGRWTPGEATVGRSAHQDAIAGIRIVPLHVTVAIKGTGGVAVANDPVLIGTVDFGPNVDGICPR